MSALRGIRGAVIVRNNTEDEIVRSTTSLLSSMVAANKIKMGDVASVIFTVTKDLTAQFPAVAARKMGWTSTPLLCTEEMKVPGAIKKCVRVLIHVNTAIPQEKIKHVYLGEAKKLRPDLK
jgi:chorismate mutase